MRSLFRILIVSIALSSLPLSAAWAQCPGQTTLWGEVTGDNFGEYMAGGTDINNDGVPDILISAPGWSGNEGRVYIYSGADLSLLDTFERPDGYSSYRVGWGLDTLGDVNADDHADILVGAARWSDGMVQYDSGAVIVVSGSDYTPIYILPGGAATVQYLGRVVACIGDITGDGVNDFVAGSLEFVGVYNGATGAEITRHTDTVNAFKFGAAVAGVGDLDGDAIPDYVISSSDYNGAYSDEGRVQAYSGSTHGLLWTVYGDTTETYLGISLAGTGDVNADGYDDVICGSFFGVRPGANNDDGYVLVLSGEDGSEIHRTTAQYISGTREFGRYVGGLRDIDKDGYADYAVGDPAANLGSGAQHFFSGKDGTKLINGWFGRGSAAAPAGDIDGNGTVDIVTGSHLDDVVGINAGRADVFTCVFPDSACRVGTDTDGDGWNDECDNCPYNYNQNQEDADGDGVGDLCTRAEDVYTGSDVEIPHSYGVFTFDSVDVAGEIIIEESNTAPSPVGVFTPVPQAEPRFYEIEVTATYVGSVTACIRYWPTGITPEEEARIRLWHHDGMHWIDITSSLDTAVDRVCGVVTSFSPFGIGIATSVSVGDDPRDTRPSAFELHPNYPNPFNPYTTVAFTLQSPATVSVEIYDILGQRVRTLVDASMPSGNHRVVWDGENAAGRSVASGVYFCRFRAGDVTETRRMLLLK